MAGQYGLTSYAYTAVNFKQKLAIPYEKGTSCIFENYQPMSACAVRHGSKIYRFFSNYDKEPFNNIFSIGWLKKMYVLHCYVIVVIIMYDTCIYREYVYSVAVYQKYRSNEVGRIDNFRALARKL